MSLGLGLDCVAAWLNAKNLKLMLKTAELNFDKGASNEQFYIALKKKVWNHHKKI